MAVFELKLSPDSDISDHPNEGLGSDLLVNNARWFIRIRWIVAVVFATGALVLVLVGPQLRSRAIAAPFVPLFVMSALLVAANGIFIFVTQGTGIV